MKTSPHSGKSKLLIVCYHYIRERSQHRYPGIHPIEMEEFYNQVKDLNNRFHMASPDELENFVCGNGRLAQSSIFLTFDDGLLDHARAAVEVLDHFNIKGAFFIPSMPLMDRRALMVHKIHWLRAMNPPDSFRAEFEAILEKKQPRYRIGADTSDIAAKTYPFDTEENARLKYFINYLLPSDLVNDIGSEMLMARNISEDELCAMTYMSESSIRDLSLNGHIIGSHGHSHTPFSKIKGIKLSEELAMNKSFLEKIIGKKVTWISYPYGMKWSVPKSFDKKWANFGFRIGFSLDKEDKGWNNGTESPFWLKRINCNLLDSFTENFNGRIT